jgi:acyl carrier protein
VSTADAEAIRRRVLEFLSHKLAAKGLEVPQLTDSFAYLEAGVLDSIDFVTLLTELRRDLGVTLELEDLDPTEYATIGGLVACLAR